MRKILEDLYYGNISPCEQQMVHGSELKRAVDRTVKYEEQLLLRLTRSQQEANGITATENFILGFRLGIRLMAECTDDNDGDLITETYTIPRIGRIELKKLTSRDLQKLYIVLPGRRQRQRCPAYVLPGAGQRPAER